MKDTLIKEILDSDCPTHRKTVRPAALPAAVRKHLGSQLQQAYNALIEAQPPQRLLDLLTQLDGRLLGEERAGTAAFRQGLLDALPTLRAFALSLTADEPRADDLVQTTLLKAWAKQEQFVPGSNLKAWLCTILRHQLYSEIRRYKREV